MSWFGWGKSGDSESAAKKKKTDKSSLTEQRARERDQLFGRSASQTTGPSRPSSSHSTLQSKAAVQLPTRSLETSIVGTEQNCLGNFAIVGNKWMVSYCSVCTSTLIDAKCLI